MLRKKGVLSLIILVALMLTLAHFLSDSWLEAKLEQNGSALAGARVELDGFDLSLIGLYVKWDRLQVTDAQQSMKNLFETGSCQMDFEFWPLFSKKLIVENFTITGIRTDSDRETDGALSKEERAEIQKSNMLQRGASNIKSGVKSGFENLAHKVNVDSALQMAKLTTPGKIDSIREAFQQKFQDLQKRLNQNDFQTRAHKIEQQLKGIDINNLKNIKKLSKALEQASAAQKQVKNLGKEISSLKNDFNADFQASRSAALQVDNWLKDDYNRMTDLLQIPELSASGMGKLIFGPALFTRLNTYLGYVNTARAYSARYAPAKPQKIKPVRLKGQDIYFSNPKARPDFWMKNVVLSGTTSDGLRLEGSAENIVSQQKLIGQPTRLNLSGNSSDLGALDLNFNLNYLGDEPRENFDFKYTGFSLAGRQLSSSPLLPNKVRKGLANVNMSLELNGNEVDGNLKFNVRQLAFEPLNTAKTDFEKLVQEIIQNTSALTFNASISGTQQNLDYRLNSNLDDLFMKLLKQRFGKEMDKAKSKIKARIAAETSKQQARLTSLLSENMASLKKQVSASEESVKALLQRVDSLKKEIDTKIKKEQKKLGKDVTKKLKGLF